MSRLGRSRGLHKGKVMVGSCSAPPRWGGGASQLKLHLGGSRSHPGNSSHNWHFASLQVAHWTWPGQRKAAGMVGYARLPLFRSQEHLVPVGQYFRIPFSPNRGPARHVGGCSSHFSCSTSASRSITRSCRSRLFFDFVFFSCKKFSILHPGTCPQTSLACTFHLTPLPGRP